MAGVWSAAGAITSSPRKMPPFSTTIPLACTVPSRRPRLAIFKSHRYIYAQLIDDDKGHTLASVDSRKMKGAKPVDRAKEVGIEIAKKAKTAKISKVVFDRGGYLYGGKIAMVADAARAGGLEF